MTTTLGKTPLPANEEQRLNALYKYHILNTPSEEAFTNIAYLMAETFEVPFALISFVDRNDVYFKASTGVTDVTKIDRHISFCAYAILSNEPTVLHNLKDDPCFLLNPYVQGELGLRFYAGAPITTPDGFHIGTVCLLDKTDRHFTNQDEQKLVRFSRIVMHELEMRALAQKKAWEMEEREAQLKEALHIAKVGSWEWDRTTGITTWSDELYKIYGVEKTASNTDATALYRSMMVPEDVPNMAARFQNPETAHDSKTVQMIRPDGKVLYINQTTKKIYDLQGNLTKLSGISQDITERIEYEQNLQQKEERFRALVQNSTDLISIVNMAGVYTYVADSVRNILGYEPEYFLGKDVYEGMHPDDHDIATEAIKAMYNKKSLNLPSVRFKSRDNQWRWLEVRVANLLDEPTIQGFVINSRDITERVLLEEELKQKTEQHQKNITTAVIKAQENERAQLGQELHDNVNQVLTTIKLYTEMIAEGIGDTKELLGKSTLHLQSCINEIRSISKRLSAPSLGHILLEDSIKELVESINLTNKVEILYSINGIEDASIPQDLHLTVYRIIQEQLTNIIKHAGASLVLISLSANAHELILTITDNGKGFDTHTKGKGIGIMNMQTRAENLGGQFILQSTPGNGCKLGIRFPIDQKQEIND